MWLRLLYGSAGLPAGGRQRLRNEEHGGRAEADGLRFRLGAATMVTATFGFVAVSHALKKMLAKAQRDAAASGK